MSPASDTTERELAARAGAGDDDAFAELLRCHQARVFSWVRRLVRREAEAVEVTQEVFIQALRARSRFQPERSFAPWLFKIALNVSRNHLRAAARREIPAASFDDSSAMWSTPAVDPETHASAADDTRLLEGFLSQLGAEDRALLLLRFAEELTYAELKQIYARPETVLKMRVHRALERLRAVARSGMQ